MRERRINIYFDGPTLAQIEELARLTGKDTLAILRGCVNLSNWLYKERKNGARLMLLPGSGADSSMEEVVFTL